ncbi:MAG: HyaD/HybD family hydrogenase maturation endopeptidase [Acidocella sp.]|nr:HyaD/HybD family hydrogenase maturation endopeptidase [Acidocella sp.]
MKRITVLGVGNILWADEGFGVRAVETLNARYVFPETVTLVDGGTQGLALLPLVEDSDVLVLLDAVDYVLEPGALFQADDDDVPSCLTAKKMSLHQTSMVDVLGLARLSEKLPAHIRLIGVQPLDLDTYGASLSAPVRAQIDPSIAETLAYLARFGIEATPRPTPHGAMPLGPASVTLANYEAGCAV